MCVAYHFKPKLSSKGVRSPVVAMGLAKSSKEFYSIWFRTKIYNGNYPCRSNLPSYIPSRTFALALMDIILPATSATPPANTSSTTGIPVTPITAATPVSNINPLKPFLDALGQLGNEAGIGQVKQALLALANASENDVGKLREDIEAWYDSAIERVSGWYKRHNQKMLLLT